ncbi:hypothetical protein D3C71_1626920 [compost metagenome]
MRGQFQRIQLGKADQQQGAQFILAHAQRALHPLRQGRVVGAAAAQHGKAQRLQQRPVPAVIQLGQGLAQLGLERAAAADHLGQHLGRQYAGGHARCHCRPLRGLPVLPVLGHLRRPRSGRGAH